MESSTTMQAKARRTVAFDPLVRRKKIPSRLGLSAREIRSLWYNDSNLVTIKACNVETLAWMCTGNLDHDNEDYCKRGLSPKKEARQRALMIITSQAEVYREQANQWNEDLHDDELIADAYSAISRQSQVEALQRGLRDEADNENKPDSNSPKRRSSPRRHSTSSGGSPPRKHHRRVMRPSSTVGEA
jgi:hypothetical protein